MDEHARRASRQPDLDAVATAVEAIIREFGVSIDTELMGETPQRVAASFAELLGGVGIDAEVPLRRGSANPKGNRFVALADLEFRSICAHHLLPFSGILSVVYAPGNRIVGIGSIVRTLEILSTRPQLQESLGQDLAHAMVSGAGAKGAAVIVHARHSCIADRGPREAASSMRTLAYAGDFGGSADRAEALSLLNR
ncbi:GTP cyclohydrolase I [Microbacterium sp. F51-2R]|uniref:GTP cyclohydrolase I n=1 Tax=Microbacterium sp. F51-2R TaxID=3445777 RepID=UPI003F9F4747